MRWCCTGDHMHLHAWCRTARNATIPRAVKRSPEYVPEALPTQPRWCQATARGEALTFLRNFHHPYQPFTRRGEGHPPGHR